MDIQLALSVALGEILRPYDRGIVLRVLSESLAAAGVTQMCAQGDMHKLPKMKEALLHDLAKDIDDTIQVAHKDTFRGN